jgi:hypothetical protein
MGVPKISTPSNLGGGSYFGGTKGVLILGTLRSLGITQQKNMSKILSFNFFPMDIMEEKIEGDLKNKMPAPFAEEKLCLLRCPLDTLEIFYWCFTTTSSPNQLLEPHG